MFKLKLLIIIIFSSTFAFAQDLKSNGVYAELGGDGLLASLNYERKLFKKTDFYGHFGFGVYGTNAYLTIPVGINYLLKFKGKRDFIEFGLGTTYTKADVKLFAIFDYKDKEPAVQHFNIIPSVSYRHHTAKNFLIKLGYTPVFNQHRGISFVGFSFGKMF